MAWKAIHRWLGLAAGTVAVVLGLSGALLAVDPVQQAWQAPAAERGLSAATLAIRVQAAIPGVEEIRRLPSGALVAFGFDAGQAQAWRIDPRDGRSLGAYRASPLPRWVKQLHRSLLLGDGGRWGAAATALAMALISASGLVLLLRRMGGWRRLAGPVRGTLAQRLHVLAGRLALPVLCLSSLTALCMSAATLGLLSLDAGPEPEVASTASGQALAAGALPPLLQTLAVDELVKLGFPAADDAEDLWTVVTPDGQGWLDRHSGAVLAWQAATPAQRLYDWAVVLHTGGSAWPWALVLGLAGASVALFWASGVLIWWRGRREQVRIADNSPLAQADVLLFVASEGGSTWGFAQTLHQALVAGGLRVHTAPLEQFRTAAATRQLIVLAATHGAGQAPSHARHALAAIGREPRRRPVAVLGFGDRQYPAFCGYARAVDEALRAAGWPQLLPLECIHQQSSQQFALWGEALGRALGRPLLLDHVPRTPPTTPLTLVSRQDYPGLGERPTAILRFAWPRLGWRERLRGRGLARFEAGDLVGILAPASGVPRFYSLASGSADGFLEICVRRLPGGLCSGHLHGLRPGQQVQAFIRANPGFALDGGSKPVILVGAGTGVAPLAGFIRRNDRRRPLHLYFGGRDPAADYYFEADIRRWLAEGRLARVQTAFSRVPGGGGHVQDALRRDAERLRALLAGGARVRVCGSHAMAQGVAKVLDEILRPLQSGVQQLRDAGRYAEDLF